MTKTIELIFDFGSPNAYLAYYALQPILERTGANLEINPCLLGGIFKATNNQAPFMAFGGVKGKMDYFMLEIQRFIARHQLTKFKMNPHFPVNTVMLMRGACAMQDDVKFIDYIEAGLSCLWEDGLNMSDPEVFAEGFTAKGLDGQALLAATADPAVKQKLVDNTAAVVDRGVFGIPSFFIDGDMYFGKENIYLFDDLLTS